MTKNLAYLGSLTLGMIAATGIATTSVQAAILGEFEYDDGTSNFFEDVNPGEGDTFTVTFSPGGLAESFDISGIFTVPEGGPLPPADPANPVTLDVVNGSILPEPFPTATFQWVQTFENGSFEYELVNPLVFDFTNQDDPINADGFENTATVAYGAGERFLGVFDNGGVSFEEATTEGAVVLPPLPGNTEARTFSGSRVREELSFNDLEGGNFGSYSGEVQILEAVPEPTTILGLLAFGGLGLGLKRKKEL